MKYQEPRLVGRQEAETILAGGDTASICETLVSLALNEPDWEWVQERCLTAAASVDPSIRAIAATCLGHLARIHGRLDLERVLPVIAALREDPATRGYAETALDDIKMFMKHRFRASRVRPDL